VKRWWVSIGTANVCNLKTLHLGDLKPLDLCILTSTVIYYIIKQSYFFSLYIFLDIVYIRFVYRIYTYRALLFSLVYTFVIFVLFFIRDYFTNDNNEVKPSPLDDTEGFLLP